MVTELPPVGIDGELSIARSEDGDIHVYAGSEEDIRLHREACKVGKQEKVSVLYIIIHIYSKGLELL